MRVTTPGKLLIDGAVPEKYRGSFSLLDEKALKALATRVAKEDPELYSDFIGNIGDVARDVVYRQGREASVGLEDLKLSPKLVEYRDGVRRKVDAVLSSTGDPKEKQAKVISLLMGEIKAIPKEILSGMADKGNGLVAQTLSGARGNPNQLMQLLFGDVLVVDARDRPVPVAGLHGYGEGVTPMEYWASASGARKGAVSVQFATAQGGYLGKQLSNLGHRVVVTGRDCGTSHGIPVNGDDLDNVGSVLAAPAGGHAAGEIITDDMIEDFGSKKIRVRSVNTCAFTEGVCAHCAGIHETGSFPDIGTHVGVVSTRAVAEPVMQSGLRAKHTGGVAGSDDKQVSGFKEMDQFLQVPSTFIGAATLANIDGRVTAIKPAPAGGSFVYVNGEEHYVPRNVPVTVKTGEQVYAGDSLSDGIPNPAELVQHKGIGEGRRYFVDKYREVLEKNGANVHRRNIEVLAKGFVNRIQITKPEGYHGYIYGDIVPYDQFAGSYTPRKGSQDVGLPYATGKFLESPYLHYTIGTRVTPHVVKDLRDNGVKTVLVNQEEPVFKAQVVRARNILSSDPDWMTQLAGEGLKKNLLESARMGGSSTPEGTSYFPAMANPATLGKYKGGNTTLTEPSPFTEV